MSTTRPRRSFGWIKVLRLTSAALLFTFIFSYLLISFIWANNFTSSPTRELGPLTPAQYGLSYEEVTFPSVYQDHLNLRGWWIPNPAAKRVLVMVHGRNGTRTTLLGLSKPLWDNGFSLLFFDLRAEGLSDGSHYSFGQEEQWDVVGAVNFVKSKGFAPPDIGAIGWSMGGASSIMAFSQTSDLKAVVSDSSYADYAQLTQSRYGSGLSSIYLPGMLFASRVLFDVDLNQAKPEESIQHLGQRHIFLIHGENDTYVPVDNFYRLKTAGGANVTASWLAPDSEHVGSFDRHPVEYIQRVVTFFDKELE
jgi:uncharacterized protein